MKLIKQIQNENFCCNKIAGAIYKFILLYNFLYFASFSPLSFKYLF